MTINRASKIDFNKYCFVGSFIITAIAVADDDSLKEY